MSRRLALILGAGLVLALPLACRSSSPVPVRLLFTGDILLSREVAVEMRATGRSPWGAIAPFLSAADWTGGNLEGAFGPDRDCRTAPDAPCFAFPDSTARLLARAGFDALSVENNHAADLGAAGRLHTREVLAAAGVMGADFAHSPAFIRVGERTIALIAVDLIPGADSAVQAIPSVALSQKLRLARTLADLVVVSVHWGRELTEWPSKEQQDAAEWLVEQGADLIVGHHPHVIQPPDCIHGHPVFYSLGNHVFDQRDPVTKLGLLADCTIGDDRLRCAGVGTTTRRGSAVPVLADTMPSAPLGGCAPRLHSPLVMDGYQIRPEPWSPTTEGRGLVLEGRKEGMRPWRSRRVDVVAMETGLATDSGPPLLLTLERHPSEMDGEVALRPHVYDVGPRGLIAKWRGTALAWPLVDAVLDDRGELCALHRGDSFLRPDPATKVTRTLHYRWNGFGFSATKDSAKNATCDRLMAELTG
ncbi:MAG TPA: CapA family protein [Gemmatimonadales bacterium]